MGYSDHDFWDAMNFGYMSGDADARQWYEQELEDERRRHQEELDDLRDELTEERKRSRRSYDDDDYDDYDDDDEYEDGDDGEKPYGSYDAADLLEAYHEYYGNRAHHQPGGCKSCLFWDPSRVKDPERRKMEHWDDCCQIHFYADCVHGAWMRGPFHKEDDVCRFYQKSLGYPVRCYDCEHWTGGLEKVGRSEGCDVCELFESEAEEIEKRVPWQVLEHLSIAGFDKVYASWMPFRDDKVCFLFEHNDEKPPRYGLQVSEKLLYEWEHDGTPKSRDFSRETTVKVKGISYDNHELAWRNASVKAPLDIELRREPENKHDANAIAVYVDGVHGGYVPRDIASTLAPKLDAGYKTRIMDYKVTLSAHYVVSLNLRVGAKITVDVYNPKDFS